MSNLDHAKLRDLFDRAMQLAPSERASFLDSECRGDAALRARADELVKAAETDGTFLSSPTGDMGTQTRRQLAATVTLVEGPGTKIGLYKLLQLIGEGGFGSVFLAEQEKPVRRRVALKIIKLGMDTRSIIARFEAERQALALMDHPHIAKVLDAGATESGRPFFVMEYVVGDAITKFSDAHKLNVRERLDLFAQVCKAVQHAHTKGIIHRDLKPGNILVSMSDGKPFAKVIDFGIAKATAQPLTDKTLFTEHRQLIGTPEYMSPEQAEGSPDIDTRTDVYALGVLLYELLTGSTPFDAKRLRCAAWGEMQRIIKEEEPPAPSMRLQRDLTTLAETASARQVEPAKLNGQVKGELDWIVMKALEKERARRYESASQLAADVQRHLAGEAIVAAPASAGYRVRKFVRRNKGAVIAGSAVAAALLVGIAGTTWQYSVAKAATAVLRRQRDLAKDALARLSIGSAVLAPGNQIVRNYELDGRSGKIAVTTTVSAEGTPSHEFSVTGVDAADGDRLLFSFLADSALSTMAQRDQAAKDLESANSTLKTQADTAEWNAYTANIALAQASMQSNNWPEARQRLEACPPSKRGWEWEFVNRLSRAFVIVTDPDQADGMFSADGQTFVAADGFRGEGWYVGNSATLGSAFRPIRTGVAMPVTPSSLSRRGDLVFSWHWERSNHALSVWSTVTGKQLHNSVVESSGSSPAWYSSDSNPRGTVSSDGVGTQFVSLRRESGSDRTVLELWQINESGVAQKSRDLNGVVSSNGVAEFSPDGSFVAWAENLGDSRQQIFWRTESGEQTAVTKFPTTSWWKPIDISPNGDEIAIAPKAGPVQIWSFIEGRPTELQEELGRWSRGMETAIFSRDGRRIVCNSRSDPRTVVWDRADKKIIAWGNFYRGGILQNTVSYDGMLLASCFTRGEGGSYHRAVLDLSQMGGPASTVPYQEGVLIGPDTMTLLRASCPDYAPQRRQDSSEVLRSGNLRAVLDSWRTLFPVTESGSQIAVDSEFSESTPIRDSILTPDRRRLILADGQGVIRFYDTGSWRQVASVPVKTAPVEVQAEFPTLVTNLQLTSDGTRLVLSHADGSARIWDIRDPAERLKDRQREWDEQPAADSYVEVLLAGPRATGELDAFLRTDESLTPLRRLVAWRTLRDRLADLDRDASDRYEAAKKQASEREIKDKAAFSQLLEAELALAKNLSPRVAEKVRAMSDKWEYVQPKKGE